MVFYAIFVKCVAWDHTPFKEKWRAMKDELKSTRGAGVITRVRKVYAAYLVVNNRGGWEGNEETEAKINNRFSDRWSCLYDSYRGGGKTEHAMT